MYHYEECRCVAGRCNVCQSREILVFLEQVGYCVVVGSSLLELWVQGAGTGSGNHGIVFKLLAAQAVSTCCICFC